MASLASQSIIDDRLLEYVKRMLERISCCPRYCRICEKSGAVIRGRGILFETLTWVIRSGECRAMLEAKHGTFIFAAKLTNVMYLLAQYGFVEYLAHVRRNIRVLKLLRLSA
jgi:hypothetical protein